MSTRGLTGFIVDGKWYATYNHSDSYPEWLGQKTLDWCKNVESWEKIKKNLQKIKFVVRNVPPTRSEIRKYGCKAKNLRKGDEWYWLLHNFQGINFFEGIASGKLKHMIDSADFLGDSLFCEWGYIIDLDEMELRVYKGNQKSKHDSALPCTVEMKADDNGYYPCKMLYAYPLWDLPEFMLGVTNEFKKQYLLKKESQNV